ncbi:hypothetical protein BJ508DRAFT_373624 [Ascobolus immersus RN42]|uniref:ZW10 C-terminal helical domain-containing protein n=1 Tax=Ascobolus immersus RN42 TaxID=1160509 RepID=A0A3N4IM77_ASCIM|nr:hypothetical protein BJ508DRAFT_373624 [Ascobolus immersus RN42]
MVDPTNTAIAAPPRELAKAIVQSTLDGVYPESDQVALSDLDYSSLPTILNTLKEKRNDLTDEVIQTSRNNGPEIESWIGHLSRLKQDIEASKVRARSILQANDQTKPLEDALQNARYHRDFLKKEVDYSGNLLAILVKLKDIKEAFNAVEESLNSGELVQAIEKLEVADAEVNAIRSWEDSIFAVHLLRVKGDQIRAKIERFVEEGAEELVNIRKESGLGVIYITERVRVDGVPVEVSGKEIVEAMMKLGTFESEVAAWSRRIERRFLKRVLKKDGKAYRFVQEGDAVRLRPVSDIHVDDLLNDLRMLLDFLNTRLPSCTTNSIARALTSTIESGLTEEFLPPRLPTGLEEVKQFEAIVRSAEGFAQYITASGWATSENHLSEWCKRAGKVWLTKRKADILNAARTEIREGVQNMIVVEEEYLEDKESDLEGFDESWEADWALQESDKEGHRQETEKAKPSKPDNHLLPELGEEDDVSGWGLGDDLGLDDDEESEEKPQAKERRPSTTGGEDEWGAWGEDLDLDDIDVQEEPKKPVQAVQTSSPKTSKKQAHAPVPRSTIQMFTATSASQGLFEVIQNVLAEAKELKTNPSYQSTSIASAAATLNSLPNLIISTFRALSSIYYQGTLSSPMLLCNDIRNLLRLLNPLAEEVPSLKSSITSLESLSKRTYNQTITAEKTVLHDLLDSAQGFQYCTTSPNMEACRDAIDTITGRLQSIETQFRSVLPPSVYKQAFIDTLLASVAERLTNDILDIEDVSEDESHTLADMIGELEDTFSHLEEQNKTRDWGRMIALRKMLNGTMAEIMAMLNEGMLEDWDAAELKDVIRALFADSDMRRWVMEQIDHWGRNKVGGHG